MGKTTYKKPTRTGATLTLKRFFANNDSDYASVSSIYAAANRNASKDKEDLNRNWLSNKLTGLYHYSFVDPDYSYDGRRKLEGIRLTREGRIALGRVEVAQSAPISSASIKQPENHLTLDEILRAVPEINKSLPLHRVRVILEDKEDTIAK